MRVMVKLERGRRFCLGFPVGCSSFHGCIAHLARPLPIQTRFRCENFRSFDAVNLIKEKIDAKLILQVHDELIFECASIDLDRLIPIVKSKMINAPKPGFKMKVPLEVEIGIGNNWDEAH